MGRDGLTTTRRNGPAAFARSSTMPSVRSEPDGCAIESATPQAPAAIFSACSTASSMAPTM
jgi:hypothetical protein